MLENCNPSSRPHNYLYYDSYPLPSRISRNHSTNVLANGIVMAFVLANGKAYYNAYNFSIDTDPAEQTFAAPSSTAIVNTIITTDRQCLKEKKHYLSANFADQEDAIVSIPER